MDLLIAPENETFPHRKRWTRAECKNLFENGGLHERYELIDGEIISKRGQNAAHAMGIMLVGEWLVDVFGFRFVRIQLPITISGEMGETTEPEPDIAVTLHPTAAYFVNNPGPQDALLIVEISDTTLRFDLTTKALLYARVGVAEYWVLDIAGRQLHRHRVPTHAGYDETSILTEEQNIVLPSRTATIRVGDLLPPTQASA